MGYKLDANSLDIQHLPIVELSLDLSRPQIIWAPNGVGKSSLYRAIEGMQLEGVSFVECSNYRRDFARSEKPYGSKSNSLCS